MAGEVPVCIDISHWQDYPDFDEVARSGVRGVIHKATEGTTYIDPNRAENLANAKNAGLAIATYFWLKPGNAAAQADFYLSVIQPVIGERVVIDYEEDGCTLNDLHEAIQYLMDVESSLRITVYSGHIIKQQLGTSHDAFLADHTDFWLAQYTTGEISWPTGTWPQWTLHQYTDSGTVPGIDGYADLDRFNGDDAAFLDWINPEGRQPLVPQPKPEQTVLIDVTTPEDIEVVVAVNGVSQKVRRRRLLRPARRGPDILR